MAIQAYVISFQTSDIKVRFVFSGLTEFLSTLDQRYDKKVKKDGTAMARKNRHMGEGVETQPPLSAPRWAIDRDWIGLFIYMHLCIFIIIYDLFTAADGEQPSSLE